MKWLFIVLISITLFSVEILTGHTQTPDPSIDLIIETNLKKTGTSVAWHPSGSYFIVGAGSSIYFFYPNDGNPFQEVNFPVLSIERLVWNPEGTQLAILWHESGKKPFSISVLDTTTLQVTLSLDIDTASFISWSPDGTLIAGIYGWTADERMYAVWDSQTGVLIDQYRPPAYNPEHPDDIYDAPNSLAWIAEDEWIGLSQASQMATMSLVDGEIAPLQQLPLEEERWSNGLAWQPTKKLLAFSVAQGGDATIVVWSLRQNSIIARLKGDSFPYTAIQWNPAKDLLATATQGRTIIFWDTNLFEEIANLSEDDTVVSLAWNPEGDHLASITENGIVYLWRLSVEG